MFLNLGTLIKTAIQTPKISKNGNIYIPTAERDGNCSIGANIITQAINPMHEEIAKKPRNILNGRLAFITPARLTKPTVKYKSSESCDLSSPNLGNKTKAARQHIATDIPFGSAERSAKLKKLPFIISSFFSKDIKNAGNPSIMASISVI